MRKFVWLIILGVTIIALGGAFFMARPVMALAWQTAVTPTSSVTQTAPANLAQPTPFANGLTDARPNPQYEGWGMSSNRRGMYKGNWNMQGGMMGRGMMGMDNCDRMSGNWIYNNSGPLPGGDTAVSPQDVSFSVDIQPILNARCVSCHGGTNGLYLTSYEDVMQGGVNGPVIIPGDPNNSRLIWYVSDGYMPLGGPPLSAGQVQTLVNWVVSGAPNN